MILQNMQAAIVELGMVLSVVLTVVGCDVMGIRRRSLGIASRLIRAPEVVVVVGQRAG